MGGYFFIFKCFLFFFLMGIINYVIVKNMTILFLNMKIIFILIVKGYMLFKTMLVWIMRVEVCKAICSGKKI